MATTGAITFYKNIYHAITIFQILSYIFSSGVCRQRVSLMTTNKMQTKWKRAEIIRQGHYPFITEKPTKEF